MDELGNFFDHDLSVDSIFRLIELKFSLLFLSIEHDASRVSQPLAHTFLKLVVLVMRMMLVMLRAIGMFVIIFDLTSFLSPLKELEQLHHGVIDKRMCNVRVLDLSQSMCLNCISDAFNTLLALDANVGEVVLTQLKHVHFDVAPKMRVTYARHTINCRTLLSFDLFSTLCLAVVLPVFLLAVMQFEVGKGGTVKQLRSMLEERLIKTAFVAPVSVAHLTARGE